VIGSTRALRVFAYAAPTDLRKGFDGLAALVVSALDRDPLSGECFLFTSRLRTRAKVLHYDGTGFCLYHKRLEAGRFASLWERSEGGSLELTIAELALYLEGSRLVGRLALSPKVIAPQSLAERRRSV
jgi:transposase